MSNNSIHERDRHMTCSYGYKTSIGNITLTADDNSLIKLSFAPPGPDDKLWETNVIAEAHNQLEEYLSGNRRHFSIPLNPAGTTPFQKQVFDALLEVPYGETRSYKQIAEAIGDGKAVRAVGAANNKNPLPIFIPCHRIIGSDGSPVGYAGGLNLKAKLLSLEQSVGRCFHYGRTEIAHLHKSDERLGYLIDSIGFLEFSVFSDLFQALAYNIMGLQLTCNSRNAAWKKLKASFPEITPETVNALTVQQIASCSTSLPRAGHVKDAARLMLAARPDSDSLKHLPDEEFVARMCTLRGIGPWTAEMMLIFFLERTDVLSLDDPDVRKGLMRLYGISNIKRELFEDFKRRCSPFGTIASFYLWHLANSK